jgi:hypothetical protein
MKQAGVHVSTVDERRYEGELVVKYLGDLRQDTIFHREGILPSVILFRAVLYEWHKLLHTPAGVQSP